MILKGKDIKEWVGTTDKESALTFSQLVAMGFRTNKDMFFMNLGISNAGSFSELEYYTFSQGPLKASIDSPSRKCVYTRIKETDTTFGFYAAYIDKECEIEFNSYEHLENVFI